MDHVSATGLRTAYLMDLECNWSNGSDCCFGTGRPLIAWSTAPDLYPAKRRYYDNLALAAYSRLRGPAPVRSSHRHFRATGDAQGHFTCDVRFVVAALGASCRTAGEKSAQVPCYCLILVNSSFGPSGSCRSM